MRLTSISIIRELRKAGFEAYWAGGCVRDMLLGIHPKDFDIATSARPDDLRNIFKKTIPVGEQYGVMIVEQDGHHFEIATFRSDSGYSDGRRPDAVLFSDAREDALRRDFTINALFYDPLEDKIYDFVDGQVDLQNKLLQFIGDPHERIVEDHLRILRAIRFKNIYGLQYHPETFAALKKHAVLVKDVSGERICDELNKMITDASFPEAMEDMEDTGVLAEILPEVQAFKGFAQPLEFHKEGDLWDHVILALRALKESDSLLVRWAVLMHDIGKIETFKIKERIRFDNHAERSAIIVGQILRRLHFARKDVQVVQWLVKHHMMIYNVLTMPVGRRRHWFLNPWWLDLMEVGRCDIAGTTPSDYTSYEKTLALYRADIKELGASPRRLLSGDEVMQTLNIGAGPVIREILDELRLLQLEKKINTKAQALAWLRKL